MMTAWLNKRIEHISQPYKRIEWVHVHFSKVYDGFLREKSTVKKICRLRGDVTHEEELVLKIYYWREGCVTYEYVPFSILSMHAMSLGLCHGPKILYQRNLYQSL